VSTTRTCKGATSVRLVQRGINRIRQRAHGPRLAAADGVLNVYRDGNEYSNVYPVWDWKKLPGTTEIQDPGVYQCAQACWATASLEPKPSCALAHKVHRLSCRPHAILLADE
jgi:hypothetical protein